ncbi:DUF1223 domain-containing protein [Rhizobium halophytocola]|uniref:DUF1223 domain-containing protein n=1 Tax=Rhizobium halophytocola TaxID=735519 RepID=A0ABS4E1T4_9HYPH|nr:DUF1223 domain-containing protein [Rhizobium halophytocola]MBP1851881.1 hypothetical protein [Rhizobium halophytocola]
MHYRPMLATLAVAALWPLGLSSMALADQATPTKAVIELFTSQGCSSCPPADETLAALSAEPGVITLAYHVDYWNYLGWADTLSSKENTARQYAYAEAFAARNVYTPQAVVNGREGMPGQDRDTLQGAVQRLSGDSDRLPVAITARLAGGDMTIDIPKGKGEADVMIVAFRPQVTVDVQRGENRGRTLSYVNSVTHMVGAGHWSGKPVTLTAHLAAAGGDGTAYAVLLQETKAGSRSRQAPGAILGATVIGPDAGL